MGLPKIKFFIATAGLMFATADIQKVPGLVITGNTVAGKITLGESKQLFSLEEAENAGITEAANPFAYKHLKAFYNYAGNGAELWVMLVSDATTVTDMADKAESYAAKLLNDSGGRIRVLGMLKKSTGTVTVTNGVDADLTTAVPNAQALADEFAEKYYPVRVILSGNDFNGNIADLKDYATTDFNRVAVLIANTDGSKEASIGLALGRIASIPVQRNIGRVKDGAVESLNAYYTNGAVVGSLLSGWDVMHDKGYIFLRNFVGKSGFFFSDDNTLTKPEDDFKTLANGFVMDKIVLIAYSTLVEEMMEEIPVTESGTIHPAIIKSWQNNIESNVNALMTSRGELSNFKAFIDDKQNVLATNLMQVKLSPQPVGYAKNIDVYIGFTTEIS